MKFLNYLALVSSILLFTGNGYTQQYFVDETALRLPGLVDKSYDAELGDLNGDGSIDIVVASSRLGITDKSYYLLNDGLGLFPEANLHFFDYTTTLASLFGIALGDNELDGDLDVVITNLVDDEGAHHYLFINDGQTNFTDRSNEQLPMHSVTSGTDAHFIDIDSDLDLDLAIYEWNWRSNKLWENQDFASGIYRYRVFLSGNEDSNDAALFDVDGDWDLDCIIVNGNGHPDRIMINNGYFSEESAARLPDDITMDNDIEYFDVDNDRDLDIYIASGFTPGYDKIWINDGNGYFTDESEGRIPQYGDHSLGVCLGDIDNDGDFDLFVANSSVAGTHPPRIYVNDGTGHFTDETSSRYPTIDEESSYGTFGDVDNDGDLDLYVVNHGFEDGEWNRLLINISTPDSFPPVINRTMIHEDTADTIGPYLMASEVWDNISRNVGELSVILKYKTNSGEFSEIPMLACGGYIYRQRIGGFSPGSTVSYYIEAIDRMGNVSLDPPNAPDPVYSFMVTGTGIDDKDPIIKPPTTFTLSQNYPNPFNPSTRISYAIPEPNNEKVTILLYDLHGKLVKTLVNEYETPGTHQVVWDGKDSSGIDVNSGVYFYRLRAGEYSSTRKMTLIR